MRLQQTVPSLLIVALLATTALGQERAKQQKIENPPQPTLTGLVSIEVEKTRPQGCATPFGPLQPSESCLGPVHNGFNLDWLSRITTFTSQLFTDKGIGFVARADGVVVTSQDLVDGADRISVALQDGRRMSAEVVTVHSGTRTAVLRVEANNLPALTLCEPSGLKPGARLDLKTCLRARCREKGCQHASGIFTGLAKDGEHEGDLLAFFTESVSTLPGAPLLDDGGHVVGLNTHLIVVPEPVGALLQFAYATPIETVRRLVGEVPVRKPEPAFDVLDWDWGWLFPNDSLFRPMQD